MSVETIQNLTDRLHQARRKQDFKTDTVQDLDKLAQTVRQEMRDGTQEYPVIEKFTSGAVDSSATGDTVLLTGVSNKVLRIKSITAYDGATGGATYRFEMDTGTSFGTTRRISSTNTNDKESSPNYILTENERIVINVTSAIASSTIDYTLSYEEVGYG